MLHKIVEADTGGEWVIGHTDPNTNEFGYGFEEASETSSQMPVEEPPNMLGDDLIDNGLTRSKSNINLKASKQAQKYNNLSFWKARKITFFRNGDPFYPGFEFIFKPGRDIATMDVMLDKLTKKMDLPRGARFVYDMSGDRKKNLDDLEDGASYVVSSFKGFKVSEILISIDLIYWFMQ